MDRPIAVAVCAVVHNKKILLIKRATGDYVNMWALPGGKIELNEHISKTAVREILEECGIETEFVSLLGVISEHLMEDGSVNEHFLLHLCELKALETKVTESSAGELRWFSLNTIEKIEKKLIPSDFLMIRDILKQRQGTYFDCVIEKKGEEHILKKFELIN